MEEKRREVKGKGEKERYTHLNAEFQRTARRDKALLSDQCKEIEENNRRVYLSFSPLPFASLLFTAICKASSDDRFAFLHFFFLGMVLIPASVQCTNFRP